VQFLSEIPKNYLDLFNLKSIPENLLLSFFAHAFEANNLFAARAAC
jgi:hypothetical protein